MSRSFSPPAAEYAKPADDDLSALFALFYCELRELARSWMADERHEHTLQPTALVHEAYLRLMRTGSEASWAGRQHFLRVATTEMWRVLVDHARKRQAHKRPEGRQKLEIDEVELLYPLPDEQIILLHEALTKLSASDARKAEIVKLRFIMGMTIDEAAEVVGVSRTTANADWAFARAWLELELRSRE